MVHLPTLSAPGSFMCSCANSTEFRLIRLHVHGPKTWSLPEPCWLCHMVAPNLLLLLDNLQFGFTVYKVLHRIYDVHMNILMCFGYLCCDWTCALLLDSCCSWTCAALGLELLLDLGCSWTCTALGLALLLDLHCPWIFLDFCCMWILLFLDVWCNWTCDLIYAVIWVLDCCCMWTFIVFRLMLLLDLFRDIIPICCYLCLGLLLNVKLYCIWT